jgi:D-alanyl-D-alanine dipeptidase
MKIKSTYLCCMLILSVLFAGKTIALPNGFVYLKDIDTSIIQDMKYFTHDNFIGRPIKGYAAAECILTQNAARALSKLQRTLLSKSLSLKVYDCYRPQTAVNDFIVWSKDASDQKMKKNYYPNVNKADFFKLGYVAEKSGHTRGSTVDLTLVRLPVNGGEPLQIAMGTHFDFMDELSHSLSPNIHGDARNNRLFLRSMMQKAGFEPFDTEWWHFTLKEEPYPNTYFNFPVS